MSNKLPEDSALDVYSKDDVEVLSTETLYQGYFSMVKYRFRHKLFAGGWSEPLERELFERGHAAALLPYDPVEDKVVLVEQFRVGAMAADCSPWQLEIVAGIIEPNETAENVVSREVVEEAGVTVTQLEKKLPVTCRVPAVVQKCLMCLSAGLIAARHREFMAWPMRAKIFVCMWYRDRKHTSGLNLVKLRMQPQSLRYNGCS